MEKDRIFRQRKEMKKQAHQTVKNHYFLLVFLATVMILFGNLYESSFGEDQGITYKTGEEEEQEEQEDSPGSILDRKIVISDIFQGKLSEGKEKSELIAKQIEEEGDISSTLGRTRGIPADVVVLLLCSRFRRNPVVEFFTAVVLCGIIEYFSGLFLEMKYHQRWWSYDGYFLNLHGRICAEGLLVFGIGCCLVVYLIAPVSDYLFSKVKTRVLIPICLVLAGIFMIDKVYSGAHPNTAEGAVEAACLTVQEGENSSQGV